MEPGLQAAQLLDALSDSYVAHRPKGTVRRARLQEVREATGFDPHKLGKEALSDSDRAAWSSVHPSMMGGEYLPDLEPAVVEIARIEMESTTGDVISLRAAPEPSGAISYQLVDEYEQEFSFSPTTTPLPLTFGEIADLLDKATIAGEMEYRRGIWGPLTANLHMKVGTICVTSKVSLVLCHRSIQILSRTSNGAYDSGSRNSLRLYAAVSSVVVAAPSCNLVALPSNRPQPTTTSTHDVIRPDRHLACCRLLSEIVENRPDRLCNQESRVRSLQPAPPRFS